MQLENSGEDAPHLFTGKINAFEKTLVAITDVLSGALLMGLVGLLVLSILSRDLLMVPIPWLEEIATLTTIYAVAFASIGAWSRGAHIAVELLPMSIKGPWRGRYAVMLQVLSIIFLILAAWGAAEMMQRSVNNRTTALSLSFSLYYGGLLLAFGGMVLASVLRLSGDVTAPKDLEG